MTDEPRRRGAAPRARARRASRPTRRARARTRRATCRRSRPPGPRACAKASAWTRMSSESWRLAPAREDARDVCSSDWTSHGSTKVEPIDSASGRTRRSMRLSTEENPTSAPSAWSAWAIPQAIEWSLATPKMSAFFPSSSPIAGSSRVVPQYRCHHATSRDDRSRPTCATALRGVRGFLLDVDGVIVLEGGRSRVRSRRSGSLEPRGMPYRVVTNTSLGQPDDACRGVAAGSAADRSRADHQSASLRVGGLHRDAPTPAGRLYVIAAPDARREFDGQHLLSPRGGGAARPAGRGGRRRRRRRRSCRTAT